MINYANEKITFNGCPACAYANHEFTLPCNMAYENEKFTLSQDWELPIQGFFVVSPKRCIEKFAELSSEEKIEIFEIVDKTIEVLRKNKICDRFNVVFEEKENVHFHIWIMPRYDWMTNLVGGIIKNIGQIFEYAKSNMRTKENYDKIAEISGIVKEAFSRDIKFNGMKKGGFDDRLIL